MAPRTGHQRLLRTPAKITSAGLCSALVVAVALLTGCGGSSDSSEDSAATGTTSTGAEQSARQASESSEAPRTSKQGSEQRGGEKGTKEATDSASNSPIGGPSQKQGPRIAQPKGTPEQAPTPDEIAEATVADITLESPLIVPPASGGAGAIPVAFTCKGKKGEWPPLRWSGVPSGTEELILYAMNAAPVNGKLFVDWAVAGLDPSLDVIEAGRLPKGAILGTNSFGTRGYELCPQGGPEIYVFAIYALPEALSPPKGFDARELRKRILDVSGNVGLLAGVGGG